MRTSGQGIETKKRVKLYVKIIFKTWPINCDIKL